MSLEKFKPVYDMTPQEIEEQKRDAILKQEEILKKVADKQSGDKTQNDNFVITPLMRKEAEVREELLRKTLPED